jgi:hypothetical protein
MNNSGRISTTGVVEELKSIGRAEVFVPALQQKGHEAISPVPRGRHPCAN